MTEDEWATGGAIGGHTVEDGTCIVDLSGARLAVTPLAMGGARLRLATAGSFAPRRSWSFVDSSACSASSQFEVSKHGDEVTVVDETTTVSVAGGGRITVVDTEAAVTLAEGQ